MTTVVKCPTCGKDVRWVPENRFRPFCSERCKQMDLGAWAAEKYRIGGNEEGFIEPLVQIAESGKTRAEELLERYEGPWQRDVSKIFAEYSY